VRCCLTKLGAWEEWEAAWEQGQQQAEVFSQAQLQGGTWVTSRSYARHQTRNGSRVLVDVSNRQHVAEVEYYVQLRQPEGDDAGNISGGSSTSSSSSVVVAMLCVLRTKPRMQHAVADLLLEAYDGDYEQQGGVDRVRAIPLQQIQAALNVSRTCVAGTWMLFATPVVGRSKRVPFS
jgi:hypothetical protein